MKGSIRAFIMHAGRLKCIANARGITCRTGAPDVDTGRLKEKVLPRLMVYSWEMGRIGGHEHMWA